MNLGTAIAIAVIVVLVTIAATAPKRASGYLDGSELTKAWEAR